ncbi:MAG: transglycosylase domain-containing protein, partial [Bacteroidota bacterium]|nr:transglycosylase domain-containing protein [Bacteroidota bacterium]
MERDISSFKKYIRIFWITFASGVAAVFLLFFIIAQGWLGFMPTFEDLENPESLLASEVVSADSVTLGKYFMENRTFVNYEEFSPQLLNALIATEDVRFFEHSGIDIRGLFRVF